MADDSELENRLASVLRQHLTRVADGEEIPLEEELAALGLDSMNAINLMLDLEGEFGVTFPDSMLDAETFRSGQTLAGAIRQLLAQGGA